MPERRRSSTATSRPSTSCGSRRTSWTKSVGAAEEGELPNVAVAFEERPDDEEYTALLSALRDQLERAVTNAFSGPFLLAAALALGALVPTMLMRVRPSP